MKYDRLVYIILGIAFVLFGFLATANAGSYYVELGYTNDAPVYNNSVTIEHAKNVSSRMLYSDYPIYNNGYYAGYNTTYYPVTTYTSTSYWAPTNYGYGYNYGYAPVTTVGYYPYYYQQPYAYGSYAYRYS